MAKRRKQNQDNACLEPAPEQMVCDAGPQGLYGNSYIQHKIQEMQGPTIGPSQQKGPVSSAEKLPSSPIQDSPLFKHLATATTVGGAPDLLTEMGGKTPNSSAGRAFGHVDKVLNGVQLVENMQGVADENRHFDNRLTSGVGATANALSFVPGGLSQGVSATMNLQLGADEWRRSNGMPTASEEVVNNMNSTYDAVNGFLGDNAVSNVLGHTAAVGVGAVDSLWEGTKNYGIAAGALVGDVGDAVVDTHGAAVDALAPSHVPGEAARTSLEQKRTKQILSDRGNRGKVTWDNPE